MTSLASAVLLALLALLQQPIPLPAPRGLLNDFAGVVPPDAAARIEAIAREVREKSGGEIAIVTLNDIAGRAPGDVALQIGRDWKVGAATKIGERTRNAGAVILLVPRERSTDGGGHVFIGTGQGTEGFLTDAEAGAVQDEALPALRQQDYAGALELMTRRVAEHYGREFGFTLTGAADPGLAAQPPPEYERRPRQGRQINPVLVLVIIFVVLSLLGSGRRGRGRGGCGGGGCIPLPIFFPGGGFGGGSGWSGGGGWGGGGSWGGGGGGGGFGGFGGGGGFSGGGAGRDF